VDRAMTLISDDEIKGLNWQTSIVGNRHWLFLEQRGFEAGLLLQSGIELLAFQHRVEPLNGGDADFANIVQLVRLHVLDVVQLSKEAVFLRRAEVLELFESLATEIAAVHEKENTVRATVLN